MLPSLLPASTSIISLYRMAAAEGRRRSSRPLDPTVGFPRNCSCRHRSIALLPARPVHAGAPRAAVCLRRAQDGRLPLHIAAMQQGGEAEAVVALLLKAYPAGAKEGDNVRCLAAHS